MAPDGSPVWPAGSVGSITHTTTFAWAAAALSRDVAGIGIDAEPVMSVQRARRVQDRIAHRGEIARVCDALSLDVAAATTLVHSAKEALFECVYAQSHRTFDYLDAFIETGAPLPTGSFRARLHPSVAQNIPRPVRFVGRFEAGTISIHTGIEARYSEPDPALAPPTC